MKYSMQRQAIVDDIMNRYDHPTAEMIYESVRKRIPNISLGTVYRNLNQLSEHGMIKKISMPNRRDRFDGLLHEHYHIHCNLCDQLFDLPYQCFENMDHVVEQKTGYQILSHDIVFHGICHECQK